MTQASAAAAKHPKWVTFLARTGSTLALWAVVLTVILSGTKVGFLLVMGAIALVALWEFYHIAEARGVRPFRYTGTTFGAALLLATFCGGEYAPQYPALQHLDNFVFTLGLCCLASIVVFQRHKAADLVQGGVYTIFGFIYVIWLFSFLLKIVFLFPDSNQMSGFWYVLYLLIITKFSDMGAYIVGSLVGKHKFFSWVSPNKTSEGFVGGIAFALLGSLGTLWVLGSERLLNLDWVDAVILGLLLSLTAIIGDLVESVFKRGSKIKDSGGLLPGIGGMLDLVDSILFTAPLLYFYLLFFVVGS